MKHIVIILSAFCWVLCESSSAVYQVISEAQGEYDLPALGYDFTGLEPQIDARTVEVHHTGHVNNYRKKMNGILQAWGEKEPESEFRTLSLVGILRNFADIPEEFKQGMINNAGGYVNHLVYWSVMSPNPDSEERKPTGRILDLINKNFGSFEQFQEQFNKKALELFGSGYVWLCRVRHNPEKLALLQTRNQDSPISLHLDPILVLDVWEHAYYLKHQFKRAAHLQDWWSLVDWTEVEQLEKWWENTNKTIRDEL